MGPEDRPRQLGRRPLAAWRIWELRRQPERPASSSRRFRSRHVRSVRVTRLALFTVLSGLVLGLGALVAAPVVGQLASPNPLAPDAAAIQPPDGATTCNGTLTEHLQLQDASSANTGYTDATALTLHVTDNPNTTPCDTSYNDWWFLASTKDSTLTNSTYYGRAWYLGAGMPKNSARLEHGWDLSDAGCPTSGKCGSSADGARTVYYSIMVCQNANGYAAGQVSGWHNGLTWNGTFYPGIDGWLRATAAGPCAYLANVQSDTIVLDQVDPTSSAASPTHSTTRSVPVTVTASDASSGLKAVQVSYSSASSPGRSLPPPGSPRPSAPSPAAWPPSAGGPPGWGAWGPGPPVPSSGSGRPPARHGGRSVRAARSSATSTGASGLGGQRREAVQSTPRSWFRRATKPARCYGRSAAPRKPRRSRSH
jgi:hypothetical protein